MATAGQSGFTGTYRESDDVRCTFTWNVEYDDVAATATITASDSPPGCSTRCRLIATRPNGATRTFDLLTLGAGNTSILNTGPQVFTGVSLKRGTSRGFGVLEITEDWAV